MGASFWATQGSVPRVEANVEARRRVTEPFVKISYALHLVRAGATRVELSVDGSESNPAEVVTLLQKAGYIFERAKGTSSLYAGAYRSGATEILVRAKAGPDVVARLDRGRLLMAECKGAPTASGLEAGGDWTAFCEAIGQLLMAAGSARPAPDVAVVAFPKTPRVEGFIARAALNSLLAKVPVQFVMVDDRGTVTEVPGRSS